MKRKRNSYDVTFKLKVLEYAKTHSNRTTEREFGVTEKMVRDWKSKEIKLLNVESRSVKKMRTVLSPYDAIEGTLKEWIIDLRSSGLFVTRNTIRFKALQLAKEHGYTKFKASCGWCSRFMKRHDLVLRQKTHIAQKLPKDLDEKVDKFHKYNIEIRKEHEFELGAIGNMDETPMFFDMPGNRTVDVKGTHTVTVKTSENGKANFTVVLACLADGTKLKPAVVFKCKTMPKEKLPSDLVVFVQEKGWVDEEIL